MTIARTYFSPSEARLIRDIVAMINGYPESVRTLLASHDSLMAIRVTRLIEEAE